MVQRFGRPTVIGSTDWAANRILRLLDREDLEKAESLRLRQAGWTASAGLPTATPERYGGFGGGPNAIADLVQAELDRRQALVTKRGGASAAVSPSAS